ncbi:MAG: hypothetical protein ABSA16_01595 [Thermoguttaceae bacterium]|jgi:hypothetical protein
MISFLFSVFSYQFSFLRPKASGLQPFVLILHPSSLILFIIALLVSLIASPVLAENVKPPEIVGVRVGIGERSKVGLWTPVEITLLGGSEPLSGTLSATVPDGDGIPSRVLTPPDEPCRVLPGRRTTVLLYVRIGQVVSQLKVEYIVDGRVAAGKIMESSDKADQDHFMYPLEAQPLVVSVGPTTVGIEDNPRLKEMDLEHRPVVARVDDVGQLPTRWYGYEGVDALVLSTSQAEPYEKLTTDDARLDALDQWIRMGGRLVLCVGSRADEALAKDSPLARFVPGRLEKIVSLRQTAALEMYCGSTVAVPQGQSDKSAVQAAKLADIQGLIEAREMDLPLIVRTARGLGQIVFVAADLDRGPLGKWSDRPLLIAKLLDLPAGRGEEQSGDAALMHNKYTDLSGQLRSALDAFTGVRIIPFWFVASMIIFYILLIGPGDYFFLRKFVRRMEWTWLSFPVIVVAVSGAALMLAYYMKGDRLRVNQADLVDVDAASGFVRGTTWLNVFSPRMDSFNLSLQPRLPDGRIDANAQSWIAWLGLQGGALGGMNPHGANPTLWPEHYSFAPDLRAMQGVPIQVWSTKSFTGRWSASTAAFPRAELSDEEQSLSGSITNTLGFTLKNCILVYDRWAYELGTDSGNAAHTLAPGETAVLDQNAKRSELKTLLTGKKAIFGEKFHQEITPYDPSSAEVSYILRIMMFYKAIDGQSYTRMDNEYQTFVDLSDLLKTGRAILTAEGPEQSGEINQGAALLRDEKPLADPANKHITLYRFVFPVKHAVSSTETH